MVFNSEIKFPALAQEHPYVRDIKFSNVKAGEKNASRRSSAL